MPLTSTMRPRPIRHDRHGHVQSRTTLRVPRADVPEAPALRPRCWLG